MQMPTYTPELLAKLKEADRIWEARLAELRKLPCTRENLDLMQEAFDAHRKVVNDCFEAAKKGGA